MRRHQIAWLRLHKQSDLIFAKKYESEVDRELAKRLIIVGGEPIGLDAPEEQRPTASPTNSETEQANLFVEDTDEEKS